MAQFLITAPDGTKYQVTGPEGATEQDALAQVQAQHATPATSRPSAADLAMADPTAHADPNSTHPVGSEIGAFLQNAAAGYGKTLTDLGRGAGQYLGLVSRQDVADARRLDAPLMATSGGKTGAIAGGVINTLPALAIPGANTVAGAGAIGAVTGALQPSVSTGETFRNIGVGGALGAGGQAVGNAVAAGATRILAARTARADELTTQNAARDATLQEARQRGYVVPPTAANPTAANTALESISGKAATRQVASETNQRATNAGTRIDLRIPQNQPVTRGALQDVIQREGQVYGRVRQALGDFHSDPQYAADVRGLQRVNSDLEAQYPGIGAQADEHVQQLAQSLDVPTHNQSAVDLFRLLNERARDNFQAAFGAGGPNQQALQLARAQSAAADSVGDLIQRRLDAVGQGQLGQQWRDARVTIAKAYQAQGALRGNNVSAQVLAAQLRKGRPVTGEMGVAARFADQFPEVAAIPKSGAGVSKLAATVASGGVLGGLFTGNIPLAAGALATSAAPYAVRRGILSGAGQRMLATPNYQPGLLGTATLRSLQQSPNAVLPATSALVQSGQ